MALSAPGGLWPAEATAKVGKRSKATEPAAALVSEDEAALERSRALYEEGRARFDTFDYEGAVTLWTRAYGALPEDADWVRNRLVYNIATAQQLAYDLDHDVAHLRQAVLLLERYIRSYKALHKRTPETRAEIEKAEQRIAALDQRIDRAIDRDDPPEDSASGDGPTAAEAPRYEDAHDGLIDGIVWTPPPAESPDLAKRRYNRRLSEADRKTDKILVASYITLGAGALLTATGAGAAAGTRQGGSGAQGGSYGTLALGLAGLTAGFTMLAIGIDRRRRTRHRTLVAAPAVGPRFAGATMAVRF